MKGIIYMNNLAVPTGEQPINPLIIILVIVAGLLLVASLIYPHIPTIIEKIKNKSNSIKEENNENMD